MHGIVDLLNDTEYANSCELYISIKDDDKEITTLDKTFNFATSQSSFSRFSPRQSLTGTVKFIEAKISTVILQNVEKSIL